MINNITPSGSARRTDKKKHTSVQTAEGLPPSPQVELSLIDEILTEIKASSDAVTEESILHSVVIKTLTQSFGSKLVQEPKFKELYKFVHSKMSQSDEVKNLIDLAMKKHNL